MPTLARLAGIDLPDSGTGQGPDGASLVPLLEDLAATGKGWALSQYPRCPTSSNVTDFYQDNKCEFVPRSAIPYMGYSLRTDDYRYTEWASWDGARLRPMWDRLVGTELYEHDPVASEMCNRVENSCFDDFENVNLATSRPAIVSRLSRLLHEIVANYSYSNA